MEEELIKKLQNDPYSKLNNDEIKILYEIDYNPTYNLNIYRKKRREAMYDDLCKIYDASKIVDCTDNNQEINLDTEIIIFNYLAYINNFPKNTYNAKYIYGDAVFCEGENYCVENIEKVYGNVFYITNNSNVTNLPFLENLDDTFIFFSNNNLEIKDVKKIEMGEVLELEKKDYNELNKYILEFPSLIRGLLPKLKNSINSDIALQMLKIDMGYIFDIPKSVFNDKIVDYIIDNYKSIVELKEIPFSLFSKDKVIKCINKDYNNISFVPTWVFSEKINDFLHYANSIENINQHFDIISENEYLDLFDFNYDIIYYSYKNAWYGENIEKTMKGPVYIQFYKNIMEKSFNLELTKKIIELDPYYVKKIEFDTADGEHVDSVDKVSAMSDIIKIIPLEYFTYELATLIVSKNIEYLDDIPDNLPFYTELVEEYKGMKK